MAESSDAKRAKMDEDEAPAVAKKPLANTGKEDMIALRGMYYRRLFPYDLFCRWLGYENGACATVAPSWPGRRSESARCPPAQPTRTACSAAR